MLEGSDQITPDTLKSYIKLVVEEQLASDKPIDDEFRKKFASIMKKVREEKDFPDEQLMKQLIEYEAKCAIKIINADFDIPKVNGLNFKVIYDNDGSLRIEGGQKRLSSGTTGKQELVGYRGEVGYRGDLEEKINKEISIQNKQYSLKDLGATIYKGTSKDDFASGMTIPLASIPYIVAGKFKELKDKVDQDSRAKQQEEAKQKQQKNAETAKLVAKISAIESFAKQKRSWLLFFTYSKSCYAITKAIKNATISSGFDQKTEKYISVKNEIQELDLAALKELDRKITYIIERSSDKTQKEINDILETQGSEVTTSLKKTRK